MNETKNIKLDEAWSHRPRPNLKGLVLGDRDVWGAAPASRAQAAEPKALRILHVAFCDGVSGSSRYICDLSDRQVKGGHVVAVALPRRGAGLSIHEGLANQVEVLPALSRPHVFGLARALRTFRPDIVHLHDGRGPRALRWLPRRPPSVATLHLGFKKAMAAVDGVVRIAPWQEVGHYRGLVADAPNWRPAAQPVSPGRSEDLRRLIGAGPDQFVIGCIGRLHPAKGPQMVLDAFQRLDWPNAVLAFIGDGPLRAELEAQAGDDTRVRFVGFRADIDAWYAAADAVVAASLEEQFYLVLLEAMSAGLPLAASSCQGSLATLSGQPVPLFTPGDSEGLAAILQGWAASPPARRTYDLARFDPARSVASIEALYRQAMAKRAQA